MWSRIQADLMSWTPKSGLVNLCKGTRGRIMYNACAVPLLCAIIHCYLLICYLHVTPFVSAHFRRRRRLRNLALLEAVCQPRIVTITRQHSVRLPLLLRRAVISGCTALLKACKTRSRVKRNRLSSSAGITACYAIISCSQVCNVSPGPKEPICCGCCCCAPEVVPAGLLAPNPKALLAPPGVLDVPRPNGKLDCWGAAGCPKACCGLLPNGIGVACG